MQKQPIESNQPQTNVPPSDPTITQPPSSIHGSPLTSNIVIMFLFYVLSITLCLSSVSTCVCVIFDPVGTFRTIANYLFYALVSSFSLTSLIIVLIGVYFDGDQALPETRKIVGSSDKELDPEARHEVSAPREMGDAGRIQKEYRERSAIQELEEVTVTQTTFYKVLAPQEVVEATPTKEEYREAPAQSAPLMHEAECGRLTRAFRPPPVEAQTTAIQCLIDADAFTTDSAARDETDSPPTPEVCASQQTALEEHAKNQVVETVKPADETPSFCGEASASPKEVSDAAEPKEHAPKVNAPHHIETFGQDKPAACVITARESREIGKWINQTDSANTDEADEAPEEAQENDEIRVGRRDDGGPLSETRSIGQDSDFQKALCVYMGKGVSYGGAQKRSGNSTTSSESSEESEYQGLVRKTFMLEKIGGNIDGGKKKVRTV